MKFDFLSIVIDLNGDVSSISNGVLFRMRVLRDFLEIDFVYIQLNLEI